MWIALTLSRLEFVELFGRVDVSFIKLGKFSIIVSFNTFSALSSSETPMVCMLVLVYLMVSHRNHKLCSFFFILLSTPQAG